MKLDAILDKLPELKEWDKRFIKLAEFVSKWSKDPEAQVGAVIVLKRFGAISLGYNGFPRGVEDSAERLEDTDTKLKLIVHAEQNALITAGHRASDATIYVWGKPICASCAGAIIQAGVKHVVALDPGAVGPDSKWRESAEWSRKMFQEADIKTDFYVQNAQGDYDKI